MMDGDNTEVEGSDGVDESKETETEQELDKEARAADDGDPDETVD